MSETDTMTKQEWCQLYRLLDKMPSVGRYEPSYVHNINDVWELVRGELMSLDLDPDDVLEQKGTTMKSKSMGGAREFTPRVSGVVVTREDGTQFETYHLYGGVELSNSDGSRVDLQIFVGPDNKVEVHAYKPHRGPEIPLCDGPV
jgi:hypothetical protein